MIVQDSPKHAPAKFTTSYILLLCLPKTIAMVGWRCPTPPLSQGYDILPHSNFLLSPTMSSRPYCPQGLLPTVLMQPPTVAAIKPSTRRSLQNVRRCISTNLLLPKPLDQLGHAFVSNTLSVTKSTTSIATNASYGSFSFCSFFSSHTSFLYDFPRQPLTEVTSSPRFLPLIILPKYL